mgnify:CR=1 FL=1
MKLPAIKTIENLDELVEVFGRPERFAARLAEWKALDVALNAKIEALGGLEELETRQSQALAKLTEAAQLRTEAESLRAIALGERQQAREEIERQLGALTVERAELEAHAATLATREAVSLWRSSATDVMTSPRRTCAAWPGCWRAKSARFRMMPQARALSR